MLENPFVSEVIDTGRGSEAIALAKVHKPELAIFDIELKNGEALNGIEVAEVVNKLVPSMNFVFVTSHAEYALDSFKVHPYDYILKPVN